MNHVFTLSVLLLWLVGGGSTAAVVVETESNDCPKEFTLECGTDAHCQRGDDEFRLPECVCNDGYSGDPYKTCVKDEAVQIESSSRRKRDTSAVETVLVVEKTTTTTTTDISDDLCFPNPCKNGGTCQKLGDFFACICPTPFCGWYCEKLEGDQSDECERWAKLGYCENAFKEFMLSNCPRACREWKIFKFSQRVINEPDQEASASGEGEVDPDDMDDDDLL